MPNPHLSLETLYDLQKAMAIKDAVVFAGVLEIFLENSSHLVEIIQNICKNIDKTQVAKTWTPKTQGTKTQGTKIQSTKTPIDQLKIDTIQTIQAAHTLQSSSTTFGAIPLSLLCLSLKQIVEEYEEYAEYHDEVVTEKMRGIHQDIHLKVEEITDEYIQVYHSLLEERHKLLV